MLILRRFMHRHSRSFFIPNCKPWRDNQLRENPLNECETPCVSKLYKKKQFENPLNECEKKITQCFVKKRYANPLNECEKM